MTLSEELQWRGFANQRTYKNITDIDQGTITFYWGVDPSASSMTVGNLAIAMMIRHFIDYGHKAILLVGGATGMIGDPDGKSEERELKTLEEIDDNKKGIAEQYKKVFAGQEFELVDNYDWFKSINYLDFLRDVGKHMPMSQMLQREFVQSRLGDQGKGISYAEFSYALIQGYDFLHLYREKGASLQVAGSDQWGNCIAGVELIRRIENGEAHVWSAPLVINKTTGKKFGKTEDGAIWLDENKTSVFKFYQFWLNVDDAGVEEYLKIYTLLTKEKLEMIIGEFRASPENRKAQKTLAYEVTKLVHGQHRAEAVQRVSNVLFGTDKYEELQTEDFEMLAQELPKVTSDTGSSIVETLVRVGLASSNTEARRFMNDGAIHINGSPLEKEHVNIEDSDWLQGYALLRRGKNALALIEKNQGQ